MCTAETECFDVFVFEVGKYFRAVIGIAVENALAIVRDVSRQDFKWAFGSGATEPAVSGEAFAGGDAQEKEDAVAVGVAAVGNLMGA